MPRQIRSLAERLRARTDSSGGPSACWPWKGALDHNGYGVIGDQHPSRRVLKAHRAALQLAGVPLRDDQDVLHSCDNPACVNPAHLSAGNASENGQQMAARGRAGAAKLTPEQVLAVRDDTRSHRAIAADYGVSHAAVGYVKRRKVYVLL